MDKKYDGIARIAVAGGITAIGLTLGGVAMANAADDTTASSSSSSSSSSSTSSTSSTSGAVAPGDRGFGHRGGPGGGEIAQELATKLGLDEEKVADALDAVRDDLPRPEKPAAGEAPTPPTEAERTAREAAFAKALAKELGVSTAKVTTALEAIHTAHEAEHRDALSTRLDTAVKAGDLTAADKASVLKAFDAGVLGGGPGGPGGR